MIKLNLLSAAALLVATAASPAYAQTATRAWVSGHGTDAAGCGAPTNPCRSLQYVHDNIIEAGGEIDILDPAGYGAITISKALSIVNDGVGTAGVQQGTAGQNAITINAGPSDNVTLRGLNIDGLGSGANGIVFNSGASLTIVNCVVRHFASDATFTGNGITGNGILIQPSSGTVNFLIANTILADNAFIGLAFQPSGTATANGTIDHATASNNNFGIVLNVTGANGGTSDIAVSNSIASNNSVYGLGVSSSNNALTVSIDLSAFNNNIVAGIYANGPTTVMLGRSVVTSNFTGVSNSTSSNAFYTFGNNDIARNQTDIAGTLNTAYTPR